jgi:hypothetical protein
MNVNECLVGVAKLWVAYTDGDLNPERTADNEIKRDASGLVVDPAKMATLNSQRAVSKTVSNGPFIRNFFGQTGTHQVAVAKHSPAWVKNQLDAAAWRFIDAHERKNPNGTVSIVERPGFDSSRDSTIS